MSSLTCVTQNKEAGMLRPAYNVVSSGLLVFSFLVSTAPHPPTRSEAVIPPGTIFLFFTFLVCGALPARRRAHKMTFCSGRHAYCRILKSPF